MKPRIQRSNTAYLLAATFLLADFLHGQDLGRVVVTVKDGRGRTIERARVRLERDTGPGDENLVSSDGLASFLDIAPGTYTVRVSAPGYELLSRSFAVNLTETVVDLEFTLVRLAELKQTVEVRATAGPDLEQTSSPSTELRREQVKSLPGRPANVTDTLPLIPGIARTPDGEIQIGGAGEHRSALVVNSTDVTDPATGRFGTTVPVDSVESIDVFQTPFLAQYGRFTAGVVSVETRRGGDKWHFELNDPFPDFRIRSGPANTRFSPEIWCWLKHAEPPIWCWRSRK